MGEKQKINVFLGLMGSGKDYRASFYIKNFKYEQVAFADTLRDILWSILGYTPSNYEQFKKSNIKLGWFKNISTGRKLLQNLGSTLRMFIGDDVWVNILLKKIIDKPRVVITDCRYDNEASKLVTFAEKTDADITFTWCCYPSDKYKQGLTEKHESEALAQFITKNYNYKDGEIISSKDIKAIVKAFRKQKLVKNK